jgi:hypothetical protein
LGLVVGLGLVCMGILSWASVNLKVFPHFFPTFSLWFSL